MRYLFTVIFLFIVSLASAQKSISDWDTYVVEVNKKPVSIINEADTAAVKVSD